MLEVPLTFAASTAVANGAKKTAAPKVLKVPLTFAKSTAAANGVNLQHAVSMQTPGTAAQVDIKLPLHNQDM